jgi:hypothetical protein
LKSSRLPRSPTVAQVDSQQDCAEADGASDENEHGYSHVLLRRTPVNTAGRCGRREGADLDRTGVYLAAPLWTRLASEKAAFKSFVRR